MRFLRQHILCVRSLLHIDASRGTAATSSQSCLRGGSHPGLNISSFFLPRRIRNGEFDGSFAAEGFGGGEAADEVDFIVCGPLGFG